MKKTLLTVTISSLSGLFVLVLPGCSKNNNGTDDDSGNGTTTPTTGCKLIRQSTGDLYSNSQRYTLEYDASGNPSSITIPGNLTETIQPTKMVFKETSGSVNHYISYPGSYLYKQPASAVVGSDNSANIIPLAFTYGANGKIATVKIGEASTSGIMDDSKAITIKITYNDKKDITLITYQSSFDGVYVTMAATGYDDHLTPYSGLKNSVFLQFTFNWADYGLDNPRYIFDQLSTHNILGYTFTYNHGGDNSTGYTTEETFTYQYNDKGLPAHRDASLGKKGETPTKKYYDEWEYDCK